MAFQPRQLRYQGRGGALGRVVPLIITTPTAIVQTQIGTTAITLRPPPGANDPLRGNTLKTLTRLSTTTRVPNQTIQRGTLA